MSTVKLGQSATGGNEVSDFQVELICNGVFWK